MRILHTVEFYPPSCGGMQEVVRQLSERLALMGHNVTVATSTHPDRKDSDMRGVQIRSFPITGNAMRGYQGPIDEYREFLLRQDFDVVTHFAAQQWATDLALPLLPQIKARKVFVPTGFSGLFRPEYASYFDQMKAWFHQFDMNVFLSDNYRDINFARACGVTKLCVIPNGAGADEFGTPVNVDVRNLLGIPRDHLLILHVGSHTGIKGHAEAMEMFKRARVRKATLLIVGNEGGCEAACRDGAMRFRKSLQRVFDRKRIVVASLARGETVAAYQQADMFLFPSNLECSPIVLFECMASKTPFLTTEVGNAAEITAWSGGGLLLPTTITADGYSRADLAKSAELLEKLASDRSMRHALAENGHRAWQERFTWEHIARQYESLYAGLMTSASNL